MAVCGLPVRAEDSGVGPVYLAAPSSRDDHYDDMWDDLVAFYRHVLSKTHPDDTFRIVADRSLGRELVAAKAVGNGDLLIERLPDIWCRDVCPVVTPHGRVSFRYRPSYLKRGDADFIEKGFDRFLKNRGHTSTQSNLILDGGNYCHNGVDAAAVCARALTENNINHAQLVKALTPLTGSNKIAVLPEEQGDTLGHVDGMVSWLAPGILAINDFDRDMKRDIVDELKRVLPNIKLVELPYEPTDRMWQGIADASGIYTNILHTPNAAYVAAFGSKADKVAAERIAKHCPRPVIQLPVGRVTQMGGSIRCFSWQDRGKPGGLPL